MKALGSLKAKLKRQVFSRPGPVLWSPQRFLCEFLWDVCGVWLVFTCQLWAVSLCLTTFVYKLVHIPVTFFRSVFDPGPSLNEVCNWESLHRAVM